MTLDDLKLKAIGKYYMRRKNEIGADPTLFSKDLELYAEGYVDAVADLIKERESKQPQGTVRMPVYEWRPGTPMPGNDL